MGCSQINSNRSLPQVPVGLSGQQLCTTQKIARYINMARSDPRSFAQRIHQQMKNFKDQYTLTLEPEINYRTSQGKSAWNEAINFLSKQKPLPSLYIDLNLSKAALLHAKYLSTRNDLLHSGPDNENLLDRIRKYYTEQFSKAGQSIGIDFYFQGRNFAENTVMSLIIDDGVGCRGHRLSIFDSQFKYVGSATVIQGQKVITVINYTSKKYNKTQ